MSSEVLIDGGRSHTRWIEIALEYVPEEVLAKEGDNLAIIGIGETGACRLPEQYREREIVLLADWIFPPVMHSEGDEVGRFFIISLLHEIAHAICRHKSPRLDQLTPAENLSQEDEADRMAVKWFNCHVERVGSEFMRPTTTTEFRELVDRIAPLFTATEGFIADWHSGK